jgi:putative transposase
MQLSRKTREEARDDARNHVFARHPKRRWPPATPAEVDTIEPDTCRVDSQAIRWERQPDDADRMAWMAVFAEVRAHFNSRYHAYCQMTNHDHAAVETAEGNLSKGMRQLNDVFTQRVYRRHGLVGDLSQGRFKGPLVEHDAYRLESARYVVLNPVRAGMVADAGDWAWSSYPAMLGRVPATPWLETDWVLRQFGRARALARAVYGGFIADDAGRAEVGHRIRT